MSKSPEKMKAVKDRIFHAAIELFEKEGYENTSIVDITQKAGVSKGTFFTHFPTKASIFSAIGAIFVEYMEDIIETGLQKEHPTRQILQDCIRMATDWCEENEHLIKQVLISDMHQPPMGSQGTPNRVAMAEKLSNVLRAGQRKADISADISVENATTMLIGLFFTIMYDWFESGGVWSLEEKFTSCLDLLYRGIQP